MGVIHLDFWNAVELRAPITMNILHLDPKCTSSRLTWSLCANGNACRDFVFIKPNLAVFYHLIYEAVISKDFYLSA